MAADFVQDRIPDLELPDIKVEMTKEGEKTDQSVIHCHQPGVSFYCGEPVKPGVGPGVLIGMETVSSNSLLKTLSFISRDFSCVEERQGNDHRCG